MSKAMDLKTRQKKLIQEARKIWDKQYKDNTRLSQEEYAEYKELMQEIEELKDRIKEEEKLASLEVSLEVSPENSSDNDNNYNKEGKNHRAWIMGIDETKNLNKDGHQVEDRLDEDRLDEGNGELKTSRIENEVIIDDNKDRANGRGNYSLLSRLNRQKQEMTPQPKEETYKGKKILKKKDSQGENGTEKKSSNEDPYRELKSSLHRALIDEIDKETLQKPENDEELELEVKETIESLLEEESKVISAKDKEIILEEILNETLGFGPITPLIEDNKISEIMVNGPEQVYVEEEGKLRLTETKFRDNQHVLHVIEKIVAPIGRRIDESSPLVDARLPDGSRVNAIIPPLALTGPTLTIRKFSEDPLKAKDLISFGSMSTEIADFLKTCVKKKLNIVVSGGTGSGKTTTLNVLSSFIPKTERIVTIEDAAELTLHQDHVVTLETRPPNMEGKGTISMRDLVSNSLRMRPDRIVVGEVRGGEALDMLQAMNTGHDGSLTTGHSNSPRDMLSRLETMVLMAGMDLPIRAIREQIASAIDLIVQQDRLEDGSRKITKISEVQGMEQDVIVMQDLFTFAREGRDSKNKITGKFESTGFASVFLNSIKDR